MNISLRNFYAANADVSWLKDSTLDQAEAKTGIIQPGKDASVEDLVKFWVRVEIAWRWIFADLMLEGFKVTDERVAKLPKERLENAIRVEDLNNGL